MVCLLLDAGASTDLMDDDGLTALCLASQNGHAEVVRLLLTGGAETYVAEFRTTLGLASQAGHVEVVQLLLAAGAGKDYKDFYGKTALMWASENPSSRVGNL